MMHSNPRYIWLVRAAIVCALILAAAGQLRIVRHLHIDQSALHSAGGHMVMYEVAASNRLLTLYADTNEHPRRSSAVVYENGYPLWPPHTLHQEIIDHGRGRFSHYRNWLYFSSRDGSNPIDNAHTYSAQLKFRLNAALVLGAIVLSILAGVYGVYRMGGLRRYLSAESWTINQSRHGAFVWAVVLSVLVLLPLLLSKDHAVSSLSSVKEFINDPAAFILAFVGSVHVGLFAKWRWTGAIRNLAGLLIVFLCGLPIVGFWDSSAPLILGMLAGLVFAYLHNTGKNSGTQQLLRWAEMRIGVRVLIVFAVALTLINVLPGVVEHWNQSGWYDSNTYDEIAHAIANSSSPQGSSYYMPAYQYGMAFFYWIFGHDWRAQQIINVLMAIATPTVMILAVMLATGSRLLSALAGVVVAFYFQFHYAVSYTQIENWYIPVFAASLFAAIAYLRQPDYRHVIWLGLVAALVLNFRLQAAFYCAALGLAVLVPTSTRWCDRLRHGLVFGAILLVIGIMPWTLRNHVVEGRLSPGTTQAGEGLAVLNDPRIGFYGLRYGDNFREISSEWLRRYPDAAERDRKQREYFLQRLSSDPTWFIEAVKWRFLAFYGLAPAGIWATDGPKPPNLRNPSELYTYLHGASLYWPVLLASALGLILAVRSREIYFLVALIVSNVVIIVFAGFGEPRLCYPVLLIHLLVALSGLKAVASTSPANAPMIAFRPAISPSRAALGLVLLAAASYGAHVSYGRHHIQRVLEGTYHQSAGQPVSQTPTIPVVVGRGGELHFADGREMKVSIGDTLQAFLLLRAGMYPPSYGLGDPGVSQSALDRKLPPYHIAWLTPVGGCERRPGIDPSIVLPVRFVSTVAAEPAQEDMCIRATLEVVDEGSLSQTGLWFRVRSFSVVNRKH